MRLLVIGTGLACAAIFPLHAVEATPAAPASHSQQAQIASVPFIPPLDAPLRYRWEKTVEKDGKTTMQWSISDFQFAENDTGYRLTITPVSSGSNETDPDRLALEKKLEGLLNLPFVLRLDDSGTIEQLENGEKYWSTIMTVLREELVRMSSEAGSDAARQAVTAVMEMFEKMPADARLALLTEGVQPVVEFGNTETEVGKPLRTTVEGTSPLGGTIKRDVAISLVKIIDQTAYLSVRSTIPRAELDKVTAAVVERFAQLPIDKRSELKAGLSALANFRHDTTSDYQLSLEDGMLNKFLSTEIVEVDDKAAKRRRVTTRSIELVN